MYNSGINYKEASKSKEMKLQEVIEVTLEMKDSHLVMMNSLLKYLVEKETLLITLDSEQIEEELLKLEEVVEIHSLIMPKLDSISVLSM